MTLTCGECRYFQRCEIEGLDDGVCCVDPPHLTSHGTAIRPEVEAGDHACSRYGAVVYRCGGVQLSEEIRRRQFTRAEVEHLEGRR